MKYSYIKNKELFKSVEDINDIDLILATRYEIQKNIENGEELPDDLVAELESLDMTIYDMTGEEYEWE